MSDTARPRRLGMLTPSSNTVLEPVTAQLLCDLPGVTMHVSRLRVTRIDLDDDADRQFDRAAMQRAARLLADAKVDAIAWNGTSGSWLGRDHDRSVVAAIEEIAPATLATTSTLAIDALLERRGHTRIGLWTPYVDAVQERIIQSYAARGIEVIAERHLDISDNHRFGMLRPDDIEPGLRDLATAGPDAVVVLCTNVAGQPLVPRIERDTGVPVLDSVAVTLWHCLDRLGHDHAPLAACGGPFRP
jgi:maleate isomerase